MKNSVILPKWVVILTVLTLSISCQQIKDEGRGLINKSVQKTKQTAERVFVATAKGVVRTLTTTEKTSFTEFFGKKTGVPVLEMDGLLVNTPPSFSQYFMVYKADKQLVLKYVSVISTVLPDISDSSYVRINREEFMKVIVFAEKEFPGVRKKLDFFCEPQKIDKLDYYRCNRYPYAHLMAFDSSTGIVYHIADQYWE